MTGAAGPGASDIAIRTSEDFAKHFNVSRETLERLECYEAALRRWQPIKNLVARSTLDDVWQRHFADSAQLLRLIGDARLIVDIGSGAGFPGLVLAILLASDSGVRVELVESNDRKCAFLRDVLRQTGVSASVHSCRVESMPQSFLRSADVVTARAVAAINVLLGYSAPLLASNGRCLFLKGRKAAEEIEAAGRDWKLGATLHRSLTDVDGCIVEVSELHSRKGV